MVSHKELLYLSQEETNKMKTPPSQKSSPQDIAARFDRDVERFSDLETGQAATIDAPLAMELITQAALAVTPKITRCLDIGCGAGNNTIRLLRGYAGEFDCDLCDLSEPMLRRARERLSSETTRVIRSFHGDIRTLEFSEQSYDVILAAAVLHHLRDDLDWELVFKKMYSFLRPGGSLWITDLVSHENKSVQALMWKRYAAYLVNHGGKEYQEKVFAYIEQEDSPRSLPYQLELMKKVGFQQTEILHKNSCFAAYGGVRRVEDDLRKAREEGR
jgi:tRNA (cmo5U34)-methyltransferase